MAKTTLTKRLERLTNSQLAEVYNAVSERKITKFSDHTTAVKRTELALDAAEQDFTLHEGRVTIGKSGATPKGDQRRITVLAEKNPKRPGTAAHARFELYKTGQTVEDFVAACMKKFGDKRSKPIRDIGWDISMKFIRVED